MSSSIVVWLAVCVVWMPGTCLADKDSPLLYEHGPAAGDSLFTGSIHGHAPPISVTDNKIPFYGEDQDLIYVNVNGVVSFGARFTSSIPYDLPRSNDRILAIFWADHYLLEENMGSVWYRMTSDSKLIRQAKKDVRANFEGCHGRFKPTKLLLVTWKNVYSYHYIYYEYCNGEYDEYTGEYYNNCYDRRRDEEDVIMKRAFYAGDNTYQIVLMTDGVSTYVEYNYEQIQWVQSLSDFAIVGFNAGDRLRFYQHPFSGEFTLHQLVTKSNVGRPGRWMYKISGDTVLGPYCTEPQLR